MYGAAAAYLLNSKGQLLIVKPNYRDYWHLPGGMIEAGESPVEACKRECLEELGRRVSVSELLCYEFRKATPERRQVSQFVFRCTFLDDAPIVLQTSELDDYAFVEPGKAKEMLGERTVRRLSHLEIGSVYFET